MTRIWKWEAPLIILDVLFQTTCPTENHLGSSLNLIPLLRGCKNLISTFYDSDVRGSDSDNSFYARARSDPHQPRQHSRTATSGNLQGGTHSSPKFVFIDPSPNIVQFESVDGKNLTVLTESPPIVALRVIVANHAERFLAILQV